jgi:RimJ/RimL family protein N-acetyltransferase
MPDGLRLRAANLGDADVLLEWRNDFLTRMASRDTGVVERDDHLEWLARSLQDVNRILLVAEQHDVPVATVRADLVDGVHELSWTVAPRARGRGVGKRVVALFADRFPGALRAEIKADNDASASIAESVGMHLEKEENGMLHYKRESASLAQTDSCSHRIQDVRD